MVLSGLWVQDGSGILCSVFSACFSAVSERISTNLLGLPATLLIPFFVCQAELDLGDGVEAQQRIISECAPGMH